MLRKASLRNIETGNLIVFGDATGKVDYDYRVVRNAHELDHLDGRRFKAYDIINDFDKIIKKLKAYAYDNIDNDYCFSDYDIIVERERKPKTRNIEINIDCNVKRRTPRHVTNLSLLRAEAGDEKVTIFDNWVKVGYNQYDVYVDLFGREIVYIHGAKFFIEEDRLGRKYLTK